MLILTDTLEFSHRVTVRIPVDGGYANHEFTARFRAVDVDELSALPPEEQLRRVWIGWDEIVDEQKRPVPFSDATRDRLIRQMYVRLPVLRAYAEAMTGAIRGN